MNEVFIEYQDCSSTEIDMAFINCMSFERPEEVFERIIGTFGGDVSAVDTQLDSLFIKRKTMSYVLPNISANIPDW